MSVAFQSNTCSDRNRIQSQGFSHGMWIYGISDSTRFTGGNPWTSRLPVVKEEDDSTSSSSIGKNSDAGVGGDSDSDDGEVQSKDNGPLNQLNALEEVLPIKRGLSVFYAGKSKSYGSLADASSVQSIQDIVKPEDAYSRKRKNMIAHSVLFEKLRKSTADGGSSKRLGNSSSNGSHARVLPPLPRNNGRLATNESSDDSSSSSPSPSPTLCFSPWRSLSLSDLQHASVISERDKEGEN